jgi:hypothetical protein
MMMMTVEQWVNDWQGKPKYSEKTCPSAALSTTNPLSLTQARIWVAAVELLCFVLLSFVKINGVWESNKQNNKQLDTL